MHLLFQSEFFMSLNCSALTVYSVQTAQTSESGKCSNSSNGSIILLKQVKLLKEQILPMQHNKSWSHILHSTFLSKKLY